MLVVISGCVSCRVSFAVGMFRCLWVLAGFVFVSGTTVFTSGGLLCGLIQLIKRLVVFSVLYWRCRRMQAQLRDDEQCQREGNRKRESTLSFTSDKKIRRDDNGLHGFVGTRNKVKRR